MTLTEMLVLAFFGCALGATIGVVAGICFGDIANGVLKGAFVGLALGFIGPVLLTIVAVNWDRFRKGRDRKSSHADD